MKIFDSIGLTTIKSSDHMSLEEIHMALEAISNENILTDAYTDITTRIKSVLDTLSDIFSSFLYIHEKKTDDAIYANMKQIASDLNTIRKFKHQEAIPMILHDLRNTIMAIPEGFNGNLTEYIPVLTQMNTGLTNTVMAEMEEFITVLSGYITNNDPGHSKIVLRSKYAGIDKYVDAYNKRNSSYFTNPYSKNTMRYDELIPSHNVLMNLDPEIHELSKTIEFDHISIVASKISKIIEMLDVVIKRIGEEKYDSKPMTKHLHGYSLALAKLIELYSIARFRMETQVKLYSNLVVTLKDKL